MTDVDPFVRESAELLAAKDRIISQQRRDLLTLIQALTVHEGRDMQTTTLVHLGHHLEAL